MMCSLITASLLTGIIWESIVNIRHLEVKDETVSKISIQSLCMRQTVFDGMRNTRVVGLWYSGTRCGMRIPQLDFESQRVP